MERLRIAPDTDPRWEALAATPAGSMFVSPPWLRALRDTYGFEFVAEILVDDAGAAQSGLAWAEVHDLRGRRVVSLPFCDYADPILAEPDHWDVLAAELMASGTPVRARSRSGAGVVTDPRFQAARETRWHSIDVRRDPEVMWSSIGESARRAVRKAEKSGVVVRRGRDLDDVRSFYALHSSIRRQKYHMLTQPFELLENVWKHFEPQGAFHLLLAEVDGQAVGATLYLRWQDTLYYKFNASSTDDLAVRPNDLMMWSGMHLGHELGLGNIDLGQSDIDQEGLLRYKEKYATHQTAIRAYTYDPPGWTDPSGIAGGATLGQLTELFVDLQVPDRTYQRAGELLYRNFC